jgi:hypothetical protein
VYLFYKLRKIITEDKNNQKMAGYGFEEESIYSIVDRVIPDPPKPPMYRSKHNGKIPPTCSTFKCSTTSKPGVQNLNGQDEEYVGGHHVYKKDAANFGRVPGTGRPDPQAFRNRIETKKVVKSAEEIHKEEPDKLIPSELKNSVGLGYRKRAKNL